MNLNVRSQPMYDPRSVQPMREELKKVGVNGEIVDGVLPRNKKDVAGAMVGIADFEWKKYGSTILPGAICEHLTSDGGVMAAGAGQTCISEFIRAGASGTSGAVIEPFAIQEKFPTPFIHVYYAAGCSLAEAYYQSISGPYQLLILGDPLCKPWGRSAELAVNIEPGAIIPFCRSGLPMTPKAQDLPPDMRPLTFFTPKAVAELRAKRPGEQLDLERDLWPLFELEMELHCYRVPRAAKPLT